MKRNTWRSKYLAVLCLLGASVTSFSAIAATYNFNADIADGSFASTDYLPVGSTRKVFDGITIADLKGKEFAGRMGGSWITPPSGTKITHTLVACGYHVTETTDGLTVQFQVQDSTFVKCVKVLFSNGADGVYAKVLYCAYKDGATVGIDIDTSSPTKPASFGSDATGKNNAYGIAAVTVSSLYEATVSEDSDWTALAWDPAWPSDNGRIAAASLTVAATSTVTVDVVKKMYTLTVAGESGKMLTIRNAGNLDVAAYDFSAAKEGVGFDATTASFTASDALKTYLREHDERITFFGKGANGVTIDYGTAMTSYSFPGQYVFDGGAHTFRHASDSQYLKFGTNATVDNPTIWARNGATLEWKAKDPCGWNAAANASGIARVSDASKIRLSCSVPFKTWYWTQQFYLEPGSELEIATDTDKMAFSGGNVEDAEQLYMPASAGGVATVSAAGTGQFRVVKTGAAAFVGDGSTLRVTAPLVSGGSATTLYKKGAGTLKLEGSLAAFGSPVQVKAGVLEIGTTTDFASGATATVAEGATLKFSADNDGTFSAVVSGAGSLVKEGFGTLTLAKINFYTGTTTVNGGTLAVKTGALGSGLVTIGPKGSVRFAATASELSDGVTLFRTAQPLSEIESRIEVVDMDGWRASGTFSKTEDSVSFRAYAETAPIASAPTAVEHTTYQVYSEGVLSADGKVASNRVATVVYTADEDYIFYTGKVVTNELDTSVAPAVNRTPPDMAFRPEDILTPGEFNFGSMTFSRATGLDTGSYRQLTIMLSREMSGESVVLPTVEGFALDKLLSTDYSYVVSIAPGKTAAAIASYIRQIVFNGCRDQRVRFILDVEGGIYRTFFFDGTWHYYQYVPFAATDNITWSNAYERARGMTYLGRQGYLATIMSLTEDIFAYKALAGVVGWLGGTSLVPGARNGCFFDSFTDTISNNWYWACGPECGTMFFDVQPVTGVKSKENPTYVSNKNAGRYFNWNYNNGASTPEPTKSSGSESCLTTLALGDGFATSDIIRETNRYSWNDVANRWAGSKEEYKPKGFVVEYGDRLTGDGKDGQFVPGYVMVEVDIRAPVVTFDAAGGSFPDGETTNAVAQLNAADGYALPTVAPTRTDYHFLGWYTNLSDSSTAVMSGTPLFTRNDHTVYALWGEGGYKSVTVKTDDGVDRDIDLPEKELNDRGGNPDTTEENGNRVWENIVAGLASDAYVWTGARQHDSETKLVAVAEGLSTPPADTGLTVSYYLDRVSTDGATRFAEESRAVSPNGLSVNLAQLVSNACYKVRLVITDADGKAVKELVSINTLGVLKQVQAVTNALVATPWAKLAVEGDGPVPVASFIKTAALDPGDTLRLYPDGAATPQTLTLAADRTWEASPGTPSDATIPRGSGVWLCRKADRAAEPYYLFGQVADDDSKVTPVEGVNLLGATGVGSYMPTDHIAGAKESDWILVPGTNAAPAVCCFTNAAWRYGRTSRVTTNVVLSGVSIPAAAYQSTWTTEGMTIPPGTGYWFGNKRGVAAVPSESGARLLYFRAVAAEKGGGGFFDYARVGVAKDGEADWNGGGRCYLKIRSSCEAEGSADIQLSDDGGRRQATGWAEIPPEYAGSDYTFYLETFGCDSDTPVAAYCAEEAVSLPALESDHHVYDSVSTDPQEVTPWVVDCTQPIRFKLSFDVADVVTGVTLTTNGVKVADTLAGLTDLVLTNGDTVAFSFGRVSYYNYSTTAAFGTWTDGTNWNYTVGLADSAKCVVKVAAELVTGVIDVKALQRYPWNGLVDVDVTLVCDARDVEDLRYTFVATNSATKTAIVVGTITPCAPATGSGINWKRSFIWDAQTDLGNVKIKDITLVAEVWKGSVDLGLNYVVSTFYVGSTNPEDVGLKYAWGEVTTKKSYDEANSLTHGKTTEELQEAGIVDADGNLTPEYDVATQRFGAPWRLPTKDEWQELKDSCNWTFTNDVNGVKGTLVTSKDPGNSNSLFLPITGYQNGKTVKFADNSYFWSSTISTNGTPENTHAYGIKTDSGKNRIDIIDTFDRRTGVAIIAVRTKTSK